MHGEDSNKLREQTPLMIAQLNPMDFCLMEALITKRDISLYMLKRRKLYGCMISSRLSTSFLHVKSGLLLPEEWNISDWLSLAQRSHILPLWSPPWVLHLILLTLFSLPLLVLWQTQHHPHLHHNYIPLNPHFWNSWGGSVQLPGTSQDQINHSRHHLHFCVHIATGGKRVERFLWLQIKSFDLCQFPSCLKEKKNKINKNT